ncbi:MAG: efflux RND transporter periplasmic adaptor subunit [Holophagales bacterium]|jgi:RND family efflux transporter MFP subunit|nr:efflux RND transporter periplasmic adaptor subunit [Holophagales bacterium]
MANTRTIIIIAAIAAVIIGPITCNRYKRNVELKKQQNAKDFAEVPVTLAEIELRSFRTVVPFTGNLLAVNRADLKAEVSGRVTRVSVFEGDYIKADQVLSVQDEEDLLLAVKAAEAQLVQAQAQAQQATADFERATQLLEKRSITKQAAQQAETYYTASQAGVRAAESNLGIAQSRLHKAQIRSPFDGQVAQCIVKAGEILNPGQTAFSIVDNRKMEIEADLPSDNISIIKPGLTVRFTVPGFDYQFEGQVAQIAPAVKQDGRTLRVRIVVPNDNGRLKSGLFADGEIISNQTIDKPAIPSSIVTAAGRGADVFVAENNIARQKRVSIGNDQNGWRPVENDGLAPGQMIVAQGRELVSDGTRLRVVASPENAAQKQQ